MNTKRERKSMPITPELAAWFKEVGASGGKARARKLSPAERRESAIKAGKASGAARRKKARAKKHDKA
jgi:hypothetical protein